MGRLYRPLRGEPQGRGAPARLGRGDRGPFPATARFVRQGPAAVHDRSAPAIAAALAEAHAGLASARSDLALARSDLDRALRLVEDEAVAEERGRRAAGAGAAPPMPRSPRRRRGSARAAWTSEFTQVRAPISGPHLRPPRRPRQPGRRGDGPAPTLLTTINRARSDLLRLRRLRRRCSSRPSAKEPAQGCRGRRSACRTRPTIAGAASSTSPTTGSIPRSGTIRARAVVQQPGRLPDPRHVRQHAARERRHGEGPAGARHRRRRPTRRASCC